MPTFSIIIPVYDVAPYLRECLDSVRAQTFGDWEAICVDDGSTDGSGEILDEYAANDKRFRVRHQPNGGVSAARNTALDMAQGEWVGFLDADDIWLPWLLQQIHTCIQDNGIEWVRMTRCACHFRTSPPPTKTEKQSKTTICTTNVMALGWDLISKASVPFLNFYKTACVGRSRFVTGIRFREDALFEFEMASKVNRVCLTDTEGYCRRERQGSATLSPRRRDDSIHLMSAYSVLWKTIRGRIPDKTTRKTIVSASTLWVEKDVRQWFLLCPTRTHKDGRQVSRLVGLLHSMGAIDGNLQQPPRRRLRWRCFLATGLGWFLIANRHNLLGRPRPMKSQ